MLASAAGEFEEKGFSGATTLSIARRAGVAEALLFKHFGSKAALFQQVVFRPLAEHFDRFMASEALAQTSRVEGSRHYIDELQQFIAAHSGTLRSLIFAETYKVEGIDGVSQVDGLQEYFARMSALNATRLDETPRIDPALVARISFVTLLSTVLFRDWLFEDTPFDDTQIRRAVVDFVMDGLNANAASRHDAR